MGVNQLVIAKHIAPGGLDLAGQDEDEAGIDLADLGKRLAGREAADRAEALQTLDLNRIQLGKELILPGSRIDGLAVTILQALSVVLFMSDGSQSCTKVCFSWVYLSKACSDLSRPMPDCL